MQKLSKFVFAILALTLAATPAVNVHAKSTGCDNAAAAAVVGGLLGAFVKNKNHGQGAAIGAAVGAVACLVVQASSQQTSTADSAFTDYQARNGGQAPAAPMLEQYVSSAPQAVERRGAVQLQSHGTLVVPPQMRQTQFREVLVLDVPGEKPLTHEKQLQVQGGGGFTGTFAIPLSKELPQGTYKFRTQVVDSNNMVLGEQVGQFQVI